MSFYCEQDYKSIAYGKLTAVLIEAIKELQQQNETMAQQIKALGASRIDFNQLN